MMEEVECDVVIVGAGAAGLMAGIHAARVLGDSGRVIGLDGARRVGMNGASPMM